MSANNYMLIYKIGRKYYLWDNLIAERACRNPYLMPKNATKSFDALEKAIKWANKNNQTEYGYQINDPYKPKDGWKEIIKKEK